MSLIRATLSHPGSTVDQMARELDWDRLNETVTEALRRYGSDSKDRFLAVVLNVAVWEWIERSGKYSTGYVTPAALAQRKVNRTGEVRRFVHQDLQHEHVVTKDYLKRRMREVGDATPLKEAVVCVVTKAEHLTMKSKAHGWQRYIDDGIAVLDDQTHEPIDLQALVDAQGPTG